MKDTMNYVLLGDRNNFPETFLKNGLWGKNQFDKVKMQHVQNASTARLHQVQGKNVKII